MNAYQKRLEAEAHFYIAVLKSDGKIDIKEKVRAPYEAEKNERFLDFTNGQAPEELKKRLKDLLKNDTWKLRKAEDHIKEGADLLKKAAEEGDRGAKNIFSRHEKGFEELALLGGLLMKESRCIKEIKKAVSDIVLTFGK